MSIYPKGIDPTSLTYVWEFAALDIPVPTDLESREDQNEWCAYLECLSPAQKLRKFGQALDTLHAMHDKAPSPELRSDDEKKALHSAWYASSISGHLLHKNFHFDTEKMYKTGGHGSDILNRIDSILDFLKSVNSPDMKIWEGRFARHQKVDKNVFKDWPKVKTSGGPSIF